MKVQFLGAVGRVTGSCSWLRDEARQWNFLVDCGLQQDGPREVTGLRDGWPFVPSEIQFVALTHAHLDHCGLLPLLYRDGFRGMVHCTPETAEIAKLVLEDAARVGGAGITPKDVSLIQWKPFRENLPLGQPRPVAQDLFLRPLRSGHVVGAVSLEVLWGAPGPLQRSIVFSGDVGPGCEGAEMAPMIRFPWNPPRASFAVLESTYGSIVRTAEERDPQARLARLRDLVAQIAESEGTLLLPAFAVGRAQDLLFDLHAVLAAHPDRFKDVQLMVDAPLARRVQNVVTTAMKKVDVTKGKVRPLWLGKQIFCLLGLDDTDPDDIECALGIIDMTYKNFSRDHRGTCTRGNDIAKNWRPRAMDLSRRKLDRSIAPDGPTVIICGSADGSAGAAAKWLPTLLRESRHVIATSGYVSPLSVMGQISKLAHLPMKERRRHPGHIAWPDDQVVYIRDAAAAITSLKGYSAHADQADLIDWAFLRRQDGNGLVAPVLFLQHGEDKERRALRDALLKRCTQTHQTAKVVLPEPGDGWHALDDEHGQPHADVEPI